MQDIIVDCVVWVLRAILCTIDVTLVAVSKVLTVVFDRHSIDAASPTRKSKPKVVIVGASFSGLAVYQELSQCSDEVQVSVLDYKTYFEFTPGVLRCFAEPDHFKELTVPLSVLEQPGGTRVVIDEAIGVNVANTSNDCRNEVILRSGGTISYDYLVLATGSNYAPPIKVEPSAERTMLQRQKQWNREAAQLEEARTIVVIGAGAVGVEMAAEILDKYRAAPKRVVIVDMSPTILPGFHRRSVKYATKWLIENGAELRLGTCLKHISEKSILFENGTTLDADLVYKCMGASPNSHFLGSEKNWHRGPKGSLAVNDHLQLQGSKNIFCVGDLCYHERTKDELKLGYTAELTGHLAALNILRLVSSSQSKPLLEYPIDLVGREATPMIYALSLGKHDATMRFNSLVIHGPIASVMKWLIEWTKVAAISQRPVGVAFWKVIDQISFFLGRTILPTPLPQKAIAVGSIPAHRTT